MDGERARDLSDLLEPTLAGARPARSPYSIRAQLIVAILGGVFAAVALCAASSRRIGSLRADLWIYVPLSLAGALWIAGALTYPEVVQAWGARTARFGQQLLGVAVVGGFYLKNRPVYKALLIGGGEETPRPWVAGVSAILVSWVLVFAIGLLVAGVLRA